MNYGLNISSPAKSSFVGGIRHGIHSSGLLGSRLRLYSLTRPHSSLSRKAESCLKRDVHIQRSSLESSIFCYDKPKPEEIIEEPVGIPFQRKRLVIISDAIFVKLKVHFFVQLSLEPVYVDSAMESHGIIVNSVA